MDYRKIYFDLIQKGKDREINGTLDPNGYYEKHHIIPKCMEGSDDPENLVKLTAREHIMAHLLLAEICPKDLNLVFAAQCMITLVNEHTLERKEAVKTFSTRTLARLREEARIAHSGKNNPNWGKHHSEETKKKISEGNKGKLVGRKKDPEVVERIRQQQFGRKHTEEWKLEASKRRLGNKLTEETKLKISESQKQRYIDNPELKVNIGIRNRSRIITEETRKRLSESHKGQKRSEETCIKIGKIHGHSIQDPDGNVYTSIRECERKTQISRKLIAKWIRNNPEKGYKYCNSEKE